MIGKSLTNIIDCFIKEFTSQSMFNKKAIRVYPPWKHNDANVKTNVKH